MYTVVSMPGEVNVKPVRVIEVILPLSMGPGRHVQANAEGWRVEESGALTLWRSDPNGNPALLGGPRINLITFGPGQWSRVFWSVDTAAIDKVVEAIRAQQVAAGAVEVNMKHRQAE